MPQIKDSFEFNSNRPNFTRDRFDLKIEMANVKPGQMDTGHISYCVETGRHYIYRDDLTKNNEETGYFRELTFQDALVVNNTDELKNMNVSVVKQMPVGKLVYCNSDKQIYYNCYPERKTYGYFNLLVNIQDSKYVSTESELWINMQAAVSDLQNAGMLTFETVEDMHSIVVRNNKLYDKENRELFLKSGQLVYCEETKHHYYLPDNDTFVHNGFFGVFRTVCDESDRLPIITEPSVTISVKDKENIDEDTWEVYVRNGVKILMITDSSKNPGQETTYISPSFDRGTVDYSKFPYLPTGMNRIVQYTGDNDMLDTLNPVSNIFNLGDNIRWIISTPQEGDAPIVLDIDGLDSGLSWKDRENTYIKSNEIVINKTKPWCASTEGSTSSNIIQQPLIPWEDEMIGYATLLPTCQCPQTIMIPKPREVKQFYINGLAGYVKEDMNEWSRSSYKKDGIDYWKYTYVGTNDKKNDDARGQVEIKVVF